MCGQTPTYQGRFNAIAEHTPGVMISGWDMDAPAPGVKHVLNFYDPAVTQVCKAQKTDTLKNYRFHEDDYAPILDWLTRGGKIKLYGESLGGVPELLKPAGWKGVGL